MNRYTIAAVFMTMIFSTHTFAQQLAEKRTDQFFAGAGTGFGQVRSTRPEASAGLGYLLRSEAGYLASRGSWSHFEASAEIFSGGASYQKTADVAADLDIHFGGLAKVGYGYSLGSGMAAVWKVGAGPVMASYEEESRQWSRKSKQPVTGLAAQVGANIIMPVLDHIDITGGLSWTHMSFNLRHTEVSGQIDPTQAGAGDHETISFNIPEAQIGLRLRF